MKTYTQGTTPQQAHEDFKRNWKPPTSRFYPLRGSVVVEYAPYASSSFLWQPEAPTSYTALVVFDPMGEVPCGTEVATDGSEGVQFEREGRTFAIMPRDSILFMEVKEAA